MDLELRLGKPELHIACSVFTLQGDYITGFPTALGPGTGPFVTDGMLPPNTAPDSVLYLPGLPFILL